MEPVIGIIALAWAGYLIYAVISVVNATQKTAMDAGHASETLDRIESILIDMLPDDGSERRP